MVLFMYLYLLPDQGHLEFTPFIPLADISA